MEEGGVGTEKATPQQRKRRERKSATMPGEAAADAATTPAPAKPRERKTTEAAKRRASSATPTPKGGLAAAGSVTPASGADGSLTPTPKRKPGRPRGPRRKSEGAPAGTTAAPTAGAASDGRSSSSAGPAIVSAPHSGAASASTPRAAAHPAAAAESAPPVSSGPKPVTHSARYLAWLTARQQQAPLAAGPSTAERAVGLGADTQTVLAGLSPSDRGVLGQYLHSLCEGASEWPNAQLPTDSRSAPAAAAGAQGVLDDNVEQLSRLLMSQYEGLSLADVNRAASVSSSLTALVAQVPPRELLSPSPRERSKAITPLLSLAATGRAFNPLAPPTAVTSGAFHHHQPHHHYAGGAAYPAHFASYHSSA